MKVKVNKKIQEQVKLFEADASTTAPVQPVSSTPSSVDDELKALGSKQAAQSNLIFSVKLPGELYGDIPFPRVGPQYATLMQDMGNAKKWKNLRGMVPDPTSTVNSAPDAAEDAFGHLQPLDLAIAAASNTNESLEYIDGTELNESIFDHMLTGGITWFKHDDDIAKTKKNNSSLADEADKDVSDADKEKDHQKLQKQAREYDAAINNYITALMTNTQDLLMLINGKGSADSVKQFSKLVLAFKNHTAERVNDYIKTQDEVIQKAKQEYENERVNRSDKQAAQANRRAEAYDILCQNVSKITPDKRKAAQDILKTARSYEQVKKAMEAAGLVSQWEGDASESLAYDYTSRLNEETIAPQGTQDVQEQPELKIGDKTISEYYASIKDQLEQKIEEITATANAKDSEEYTNAKTQMEALKKFADESIAKRIDIVCKTGSNAGGEQQGVGHKILAFLSKHPLRAEKLKTCWATHSQDLNDRMKQKLDMIASAKSGTALGFCKEIANQTIPELFARMLTYKAVLIALQQHNIYKTNDPVQIKKMSDDAAEEDTARTFRESVALALVGNGALVSSDTSSIFAFDQNNNLVITAPDKAKYIGLLVYAIYSSSKKPIDLKQLTTDIATLKGSLNDGNAFLDNVIKIMLNVNPNIISSSSLDDILSAVNPDKATYDSVIKSLENLNTEYNKNAEGIQWCLACLYSNPSVAKNYMETSGASDAKEMNNNTSQENASVEYHYITSLNEADKKNNIQTLDDDDNDKIQPKDADIEKASAQLKKLSFDPDADYVYTILNTYDVLNIKSINEEESIVPNKGQDINDKVTAVKNVSAILLSNKLQETMSNKQKNLESKKAIVELHNNYMGLDKNGIAEYITSLDGKPEDVLGTNADTIDGDKVINKFKELLSNDTKINDQVKGCKLTLSLTNKPIDTLLGNDGLLESTNISNSNDIDIDENTKADQVSQLIANVKKVLLSQLTNAIKEIANDPMTLYKAGFANLRQMIIDAQKAKSAIDAKLASFKDDDPAKATYNKLLLMFDAVINKRDLDDTLKTLVEASDEKAISEAASKLSDKAKSQLESFGKIESISLPTWQAVAKIMYGKTA